MLRAGYTALVDTCSLAGGGIASIKGFLRDSRNLVCRGNIWGCRNSTKRMTTGMPPYTSVSPHMDGNISSLASLGLCFW